MEFFLKCLVLGALLITYTVFAVRGQVNTLAGILLLCILSVNLGLLLPMRSVSVRLLLSAGIFCLIYFGTFPLVRWFRNRPKH